MGDGDAGEELVFVSYSHADAAWVQRFTVLLKPLLRTQRLRLWADTSLRGGDVWGPEIEAAIARSTAALLLVSGDFLASDFVVDHELPALVRRGVRLLPVLVGECLWQEEPALADRQWLHDPRRDGPLGRDAGDPSRRDERLVAVCRKLVAALPGVAAAEPEPVTEPALGAVAEVPAGTSTGALFGVPEDPPGYVVRDALAALIEAVTASSTGAVGVTAEAASFGLHGQGGIGKSVLAAALGRDHRIRCRFSDGVFWVTLGERADVLAAQLDLLARLGSTAAPPRTIGDATARLRSELRDRRVLLLVDDVWSDAAAHAFRVTGGRGRVLYTTRDCQVVAAVGADEYPIGVLSAPEARAVATAVLGASALPATADHAFAEVGRVALAVALLAAAVRGGRSWEEVADALDHELDVYSDHPYANTFKAMQVAVAALPADLGAALLSLAVFPPDTVIPLAAVARYWVHTRGPDVDASTDLDLLADANVLRRETGGVGFHDLQHDFLLLHSAGLPTLHADLLAAYRVLLPDGGDWWQLPPDEPYIWDHLTAHLAGAGERRPLAATVTDSAYIVRRIDGNGLHAAEADLTRAGALLPENPLVVWWRQWLARHAAFLAGGGGEGSVAPTMLAWLQADRTRPPGVDPERVTPVLPSPYLAVCWGSVSPEPALVRQLTGHRSAVQAVDWSPDGTLVAGGAADGRVRLWDPGTGNTVAVVDSGPEPVSKVAWAPDSRHLAATSGARLFLRDGYGRPEASPLDGLDGVADFAWSPDGCRLALVEKCAGVGTLRLRGLGGELDELDELDEQRAGAVRVSWSADGEKLVSADVQGVVEVWDVVTRRRTGDRRSFQPPVTAVACSPRSPLVAVVSAGRVHLWHSSDDTVDALCGSLAFVTTAAWSATGDRLAVGHLDVQVWEPVEDRWVTLGSHTGQVTGMAWLPGGGRLATAGGDNEVQIWDTAAVGADVAFGCRADWIHAVAISHDGGRVAAFGGARRGTPRVHVYDVADGSTVAVAVPGGDRTLTWSADGRFLHIAGTEPRQWEHATGSTTPLAGWLNDSRSALLGQCAWAPGGKRLAVVDADRIRLWDADDPAVTTTIRYSGEITSLSWSGDAVGLAACGHRGTAIWKINGDGARLAHHHVDLRDAVLAWSPDFWQLAAAVQNGPLIVWDPANDETTTVTTRVGAVTGVAWSPDGRHVITTSEDGAVAVHPVDGAPGSRLQLAGANCVAWAASTIAVGQRTGWQPSSCGHPRTSGNAVSRGAGAAKLPPTLPSVLDHVAQVRSPAMVSHTGCCGRVSRRGLASPAAVGARRMRGT